MPLPLSTLSIPSGAVVSTVASEQEGPGFESQVGLLWELQFSLTTSKHAGCLLVAAADREFPHGDNKTNI